MDIDALEKLESLTADQLGNEIAYLDRRRSILSALHRAAVIRERQSQPKIERRGRKRKVKPEEQNGTQEANKDATVRTTPREFTAGESAH